MTKKIKSFFVFLFFSLVFSVVSGRMGKQASTKGEQEKVTFGFSTAQAAIKCCPDGICTRPDGGHYCC